MSELTKEMKLFLNYQINEKLQHIENVDDNILIKDLKIIDEFVSVFDNVDFKLCADVIDYCMENKNKIHKKFKNFERKSVLRCLNNEQIEFIKLLKIRWIEQYGDEDPIKNNVKLLALRIRETPLFSYIPTITVNYVVAVNDLLTKEVLH